MANEILITGGAGFIGQALVSALLAADSSLKVTLTDVVQPPVPAGQESRVTSLKADLTDPSAVASLLDRRFAAVYVLHGLMSGGAEANLDLGLRVNVDSVRVILDRLRASHPGTVVVFASSCAVYGKADPVRELETLPQPKSSYGAEKLIVELLLNDYSRRGLLDGRIVRLPTVIVRPGAPSAAASSFASGIVRESLQGVKNVLPVARDLEMWVCSPATVVKNLVKVKDVPAEKLGGTRIVNLPGITVTVQEILDALEQVGGKEALGYLEEKRDPAIEAIVGSWPARFDVSRALGLGLEPDGRVIEAVKAFKASL
ncbi:NAD dependent epimerase/dehydratase [Plectosphaerella plurivora]|uniref:NAD dependent epimerase/dehydratase n=1 Tax=Plectosphaerella plurivora TaxID=936078 RepID=A0A9P9A6T0_9PEZI|nr:NAD dependent epimerase/dehydratase [Plectosphaerella plurivora]